MLKTNKKIGFFIIFLVCCISTIKTITNERKLTLDNYKQIYRLKLDGEIQDLDQLIRKLNQTLSELEEKKIYFSHEIERLEQEKFLSYHIKQYFHDMYTPKHRAIFIISPIHILDLEPLRLFTAYGLFPITIPFIIITATAEWIVAKKNIEKKTEKVLEKTVALDTVEKSKQKINDQIKEINQKKTLIETEQTELTGLNDFIETYTPGNL